VAKWSCLGPVGAGWSGVADDTENPSVGGSIPSQATRLLKNLAGIAAARGAGQEPSLACSYLPRSCIDGRGDPCGGEAADHQQEKDRLKSRQGLGAVRSSRQRDHHADADHAADLSKSLVDSAADCQPVGGQAVACRARE
jgi:hypothetical protein